MAHISRLEPDQLLLLPEVVDAAGTATVSVALRTLENGRGFTALRAGETPAVPGGPSTPPSLVSPPASL